MPRSILILSLILCFRTMSFAVSDEKAVATVEIDNSDYYPFMIFLSNGEDIRDDSSESDDYHGYFYRLAVAQSEIYKIIYIEKISYGLEGCCMKIQSSKMIDYDDFAEKFGYSQHLIVCFEFISWCSPTSFICKVHGDFFVISEIDKPEIRVLKIE